MSEELARLVRRPKSRVRRSLAIQLAPSCTSTVSLSMKLSRLPAAA